MEFRFFWHGVFPLSFGVRELFFLIGNANFVCCTETVYAFEKQQREIDAKVQAHYNTWGWTRANDILSGKEMDAVERVLGETTHGGKNGELNKYGERVIQLGEEQGVDNVVVVLGRQSRLGNPNILRVYRIDSEYETLNDDIRKGIYDAERTEGGNASQVIEYLGLAEMVVEYDGADFKNTKGMRNRSVRSGRASRRMDREVGAIADGSRSDSASGRDGAVDETRFSARNTDRIDGKVYEVQKVIGDASDGKKYLYEVLVKKENTAHSIGIKARMADVAASPNSGISGERVPQNAEIVNASEENSALSTRAPDKLSDRELLVNALESATGAKDERDMPA